MLRLTDDQANDFRSAVQSTVASADSTAFAALEDVYSDLAAEVDRRRPICTQSGKCCHFDDYGHLLFVTTLELAAFVRSLPPDQPSQPTTTGCPFQLSGLCSVHSFRPLGCRIFYCDPTSQSWQQQLYEQLHRRISDLHVAHAIPYFLVEWRTALATLGLAQNSAQPPPGNLISLTVSRGR